ncbi:hypothetical protein M199_gp052 [Halogranum tailed virus 1]|uniref:Uncharacterized protein n=1 Tax=Halogranum tailed virus 1 TaxID=1273749 RepID=R4TL44_9CAUD|nr:hypothetical protein M199_gp052 [Halogranum tailed virus 1]AGM11382.1 hypothetical protein HGTV1_52 [Halogranum tailed virus 1]
MSGFNFNDGSKKMIMVCGATTYDDPFGWQEDVSDEYPDYDFINPYQIGDDVDDPYDNPDEIMEPVVDKMKDVDGLLVSWQDDAFLVGAVVYMYEAFKRDIPIVIWYQGKRDKMQIPLSWMMHSYHSDRDTAIRVLLARLGDKSVLVDEI